MPEFIPIPNCVKVDLIQQWNGQVIDNVFHFAGAAAWTVEDMYTLAATCENWWKTNMAPSLSTEIALVMIKVTDQSSQYGFGIEVAIGGSNSGSVNTPSVPNSVAVAVKLVTNLRGRSYRGRSYVAGIAAGNVSANTLAGPMVTALKEAYEALRDETFPGDNKLVIASRFTASAPRTTGITTPVTGVFVDATIDSQRRRLPGRGR